MSRGEDYAEMKDQEGTFEWVFGLLRDRIDLGDRGIARLMRRCDFLEAENKELLAQRYEADSQTAKVKGSRA